MSRDEDLQLALERHLACSESGRETLELLSCLKDAIQGGRRDAAAAALQMAIVPSLDYTSAQGLYRLAGELRPKCRAGLNARVAVLGNSSAEQLTQLIDLFLLAAGIHAEFYRPEYGVLRQEILDPTSALYKFKPRVVFLATGWRDLGHIPQLEDSADRVRELRGEELNDWTHLWERLHERLDCQIIQNNFDAPPWRPLDNHEMRFPASLGRFIAEMNRAFVDHAPPHVTIHDLDNLSAQAGRWRWADERFFHHAKLPCAPECLVNYAHSVSSLIAAQLGLSKKCLVMDLDNTLWGGVIGDDGLGGIRLGQGDAEGEAFQSFQRYLKQLKGRGVLLAVCSKNEDSVAREVFEKHQEMVLRLEDISCFVANWDDKASNLGRIAKDLNIGLDALAFVDDNPAERAIVRQLVPEVAVPEMPLDPADFIRVLESYRYFQVVSVSEEDFRRSEMYRANSARIASEATAGDVEQYLRSLRMKAVVEPVNEANIERAAQLINKSNQFNLTTRRYSAAEVMAKAQDPRWITRTVSLADRFGDNGRISVLLARIEGDALVIDTWLMSCRVLKRGVEDLLLNHLYELARARGLCCIRGEYIPTPRNGLVREHYPRLGFERISSSEDGHTWWQLAVNDSWPGREVCIEEVMAYGTSAE